MSEMLGNQYFLSRNYTGAVKELEEILQHDPKNKQVRRKLVVSYTQTFQIDQALELFVPLIKEDISFIINTNAVDDDCPCAELVYNAEKRPNENKNSLDFHNMMGMLWLFCDIKKSLIYFENALQIEPDNIVTQTIIQLIKTYIQENTKSRNMALN